jgi:hypothetical protein
MKERQEIITFKVDGALFNEIRDISNRSEFIRKAIIAALGSACPLCNGTGLLTPSQKRHWDDFAIDHSVKRCEECHEFVLICSNA